MIINKEEIDSDLIHDIDLELTELFESNRTWEINTNSWNFYKASIVQIIIRGSGHCYVSSIQDIEWTILSLINTYRDSNIKLCTSTSYYDPLKHAIVLEYTDFITLETINI